MPPPNEKDVPAGLGDEAVPKPNVFGGVEGFVLLEGVAGFEEAGAAAPKEKAGAAADRPLDELAEVDAAGTPKLNPANGFGAAGLLAASEPFASLFSFSLSSFTVDSELLSASAGAVSLKRSGLGWRARLGWKADEPDSADGALLTELAGSGDGEGDFSGSFSLDGADEGRENWLFGSDESALLASKVKPPFAGAEELLVDLLASGLKDCPANVNAAGGAGGAGPFFSGTGSAFFSSGLLAAGAPNENPEKGFGAAAGAGVLSFVLAEEVEGTGEEAALPKAKPANGFAGAGAAAG